MDDKNFGDFYSKYRRFSVKIARAVLKDMEAAEDVCQEVFAGLYNIRNRLDNSSESRIKALVYFATYNKCLDYCRRTNRKREVGGMEYDMPDDRANPEMLILKKEENEYRKMALRKLRERNPRSYDILIKTKLLEIPPDEVAAEYGIKKCNVHNCIYRARKCLKAELKKLRR